MRTKILLANMLMLPAVATWSQTYKALNNVKIKNNFTLLKTSKVKNCPQPVDTGAEIKKEMTFKNTATDNEETTYTITEEKKASANEIILVDKKITNKLESFEGKANIFVDETDKSKIHINYWLNGKYTVKKKVKVKSIERKLQCDGTYLETDTVITELPTDTKYDLWRCSTSEIDSNPDFYKHSNKVVKVYKADGSTIDYYLVNKYDRAADYVVQLDNRQLITFKETGLEFGPITIPIKIRPGFKGNIDQEFTGDLNVGAFGGFKIGRYRARYVRGEGFTQLPASFSCTVGGFLSFSAAGLDKTNTTGGENPIADDSKQTIGVVSPGIGVMYSIYNFQIGFFSGLDLGVGGKAKNWNYNNKPWIGFGFAYNLSNFWKK